MLTITTPHPGILSDDTPPPPPPPDYDRPAAGTYDDLSQELKVAPPTNMPPLENGLENLRSISPGSSASQEDFWSRNLDCLEYLSLHPSDTASFCSSRVLSQRPPGADRRFRHPLGRLSTLSDNDGEEELQSELQSELAEDEDFAPSEFSANTRMAAEHHLREVEEELQNIFTPTPVELLRVTLIKPPDQGDFGFGLSDGVYEKGVYISALRPGGPGEKSGFLRPYDRILQVGIWYPLVMTDKIGIGFCTGTNNFSCVGLTTRITVVLPRICIDRVGQSINPCYSILDTTDNRLSHKSIRLLTVLGEFICANDYQLSFPWENPYFIIHVFVILV